VGVRATWPPPQNAGDRLLTSRYAFCNAEAACMGYLMRGGRSPHMIGTKLIANTKGLLGGKGPLKRVQSTLDLDRCVRSGLRFSALQSFARHINLTPARLAGEIGIAPATYDRRRRQSQLNREESEVLSRVARVVALGCELFGSAQATWRWLEQPNPAWQNSRPLDLLQTELGGREVEAVIGRRLRGAYD